MGKIQASFDAFVSSGGLTVETELRNILSESSVKGVILGGSATDAIKVVNNPATLKNYLINGSNFDVNTSPGVPLSYTLRFIKDNSIASVVKYDKFTIRECTIIPPTAVTITPNDIDEIRLNHVRGDKEFSANGPSVSMTTTLDIRANQQELWAKCVVTMVEVGGDHTTGERTYEQKIWTAPSGKKINSIVSKKVQTITYTDNDINYDPFYYSPSEVIKYVKFRGDTDGDDLDLSDIESTGHVHHIDFSPVTVELLNR